ncbi:DUF5348 domain-containing protein [Neobacillus drentensis]|uniref:DUF5348 domain-containing protein n=1 Tax=Neobacillus drentensis TaxID=220684 RepID=UPI002FFE86DA
MELNYALKLINELKSTLSKFGDNYGYFVEDLIYDSNNPEEKSQACAAKQIISKLDNINALIKWIDKPVKFEGRLIKNKNDRYEVEGIELSSGHPLDFFNEEENMWVGSRVEHNGDNYYIYDYGREKEIEGILVRIK